MTDTQTHPSSTTPQPPAVVVPDKPALEGLEDKWAQRWEADGIYALRPHQVARRGLLDRHPAADRVRARSTSAACAPTRSATSSPATSGCAARRSSTRSAGTTTACPPSAGCRTSSASAATRRCRTTPTSPRPRSPTPSARCRSAGRTSSSSASGSSPRTRSPSRRLFRQRRAVGRLELPLHDHRRRRRAPRRSAPSCATSPATRPTWHEAPTLWDVTFQTAVAQAELEAREYPGALLPRRVPRGRRRAGVDRDHPARADPGRGRADRPPRRRALPAAVRYDGDHAGLRRRDPGRRPPGRRARQGRRHRDVLHVRRPHRRAVVARAPAAGPRPSSGATAGSVARPPSGSPAAPRRRRTPSWPARPRSPPARRWSALLRETGDLDGEPTPTQRMANFYEKGDKPLEIVSTRQWYIRNGGRDADLRSALRRARRRDHVGAAVHAAPLHELGRGSQRRLADLAGSGSSGCPSRSGTPSTTRASRSTTS